MNDNNCKFCKGTTIEPGHIDCTWCDSTGRADKEPVSLRWRADGDANVYTLLRENNWVASLRMNGEMLVQQQEAILDQFISATNGVVQLQADALRHIIKTVGQSRTSTRRLRWIGQRAQWALDGTPYDNSAFDLPKNAKGTAEKLSLECARLRAERDALQCRLNAQDQRNDDLEALLRDTRWRIVNKDTSTADYQRLDKPVVERIDAALSAPSTPKCEHRFMHFGEQKSRRCADCCVIEGKAHE